MSKKTYIHKAIPVFPQPDVQKAHDFYVEKLGFEEGFVYDGEYAGVVRGNFELHFWKCDDKKLAENTSCRVQVVDIDDLYEELTASGVIHPNGKLQSQPWGYREFSILDEVGNLIKFAEEIPGWRDK